MIVIPYDPIGAICVVNGRDIRRARLKAGFENAREFAGLCGLWGGTKQNDIESRKRVELRYEEIARIINVCNGDQ